MSDSDNSFAPHGGAPELDVSAQPASPGVSNSETPNSTRESASADTPGDPQASRFPVLGTTPVREVLPPRSALPVPIAETAISALGPFPNERKAREHALVLQSMSIEHLIRRTLAGWVVLVQDADYAAAAQAIDRYEAENRDWPPPRPRERPRHRFSVFIPLAFAALVAFFLVTGPANDRSVWFVRGVALSSQVLGSQPWRAVTALSLHADAVHVLGNAISGTVFVSAVQRRLGTGGAALTVLVSGALGNMGNALYHRLQGTEHASIGASTAVFGAIGLLTATQLVLNRPRLQRRPWTEILGPIVGGFALLGALGSGGERTDLGAHLFGLLAGILIGLAVGLPMRRATYAVDMAGSHQGEEVSLGIASPRAWIQGILYGIAIATVVACWQLALRR